MQQCLMLTIAEPGPLGRRPLGRGRYSDPAKAPDSSTSSLIALLALDLPGPERRHGDNW